MNAAHSRLDAVCEQADTIPFDDGELFLHGGTIEVVGEGRTLRVDEERRLVGRAPGCALVLRDETVSAVHLEVQATTSGLRLVDLGSSNGTFLGPDGVRVGRVVVTKPCELRCGAQRLHFRPTAQVFVPKDGLERFGGLVGGTPEMCDLFAMLRRYADSSLSILIRGETGTGKERVARALHEASSRRDRPFEALNCSAIPDSLLEAELFGSTAGAYTGAQGAREGRFVEADGGTIFFDEVAEMSPAMQAKLLRVLQEREVRPLGGKAARRVDVRALFATNADLRTAVNEGRFRADLYFRIAPVTVEIPPLRERIDDLQLLVDDILGDLAESMKLSHVPQVDRASMALLRTHRWPGNVRELENVLRVAVCTADRPLLTIENLGAQTKKPAARRDRSYAAARTAFELEYYSPLYVAHDGNISRIARISGRERSTVKNALLALGLRNLVE
jgi:DNA-binding NtrC family response regulator